MRPSSSRVFAGFLLALDFELLVAESTCATPTQVCLDAPQLELPLGVITQEQKFKLGVIEHRSCEVFPGCLHHQSECLWCHVFLLE